MRLEHYIDKYLHNYFDYIIDFMLCCVENNKYIDSIPEMVMELSIENKMHINYLIKIYYILHGINCLKQSMLWITI